MWSCRGLRTHSRWDTVVNVDGYSLMGILFVSVFFGFWFWNVYQMLVEPTRWVGWMYGRQLLSMGLRVVIEDERKLRRVTKRLGWFFLVAGLLFIGIILWDLTTLDQ